MGRLIALAFLANLAGCGPADRTNDPAETEREIGPALESITAEDLLRNTSTLASDEFEGRAPGSPGEEKTVAFLQEQFSALGLAPGNPNGTFTQDVPLVGLRTSSTAFFQAGGRRMNLTFAKDYVAVTRHLEPRLSADASELVFVGYGVVAPEYGWDDYKDVDVRGKTIVMLINDPAIPDPADSTRLDPSIFNGKAMTYYGRWTYKYEIASEKGAAAAIIIHETGPAGYPWEVVSGSWGVENFDIKASGPTNRVKVESWITLERAKELFTQSGQDFDALKKQALSKDFKPVPLRSTVTFQINNAVREVQSRNVIAKLEGAHPERKNEYVIYTAHWDHLGKSDDAAAGTDNIFNGAADNAIGVAGLLELARAFSRLPEKPDRTILFLAVTAEEKGLLGAKYYAANPLYPLEKTLANINMDGLNTWGRTSDVVAIGHGNSTLDDLLAQGAALQNRTVAPDPESEKGFYYRSDHFEFAKQGVPALYIDDGVQYVDKPAGYGQQKRNEWTQQNYHKPSDEPKPDWDLAGAVEDLQLLFRVGYSVAKTDVWPEWKSGTEFKAKRDAMLGKGAGN